MSCALLKLNIKIRRLEAELLGVQYNTPRMMVSVTTKTMAMVDTHLHKL